MEHRGDVAVLTINRPEALNALNDEVISQLDKALDSVDPAAIRCLIVTGAGQKAFVAGADIAQMSELTKAEGEAFGKHGNDVFRKLETLPIPTIAVVNGFALGGGCELSMSFNNTDIAAFKDVWVFCEQRQGKLMPTDFELISEGRKLADELGVALCGLLLGDKVEGLAKELGGYGADKVYVCESPMEK